MIFSGVFKRAKYLSIAMSIALDTRFRKAFVCNNFSSSRFERYPSSTKTDGYPATSAQQSRQIGACCEANEPLYPNFRP